MARTHVILDGLYDPRLGRELSSRWVKAGFNNTVDVAGQSATLAPADGQEVLTEIQIRRAAAIARAFGLEIRNRIDKTFKPDNHLQTMRSQIAREYRKDFATALVFGLPALGLHYFGPMLASGAGLDASKMIFPWLIEMALVGWACVAAGSPILWQAGISLIHLRTTADLLTGLVVVISFIPSAFGVLSLIFVDNPWFGDRPMFHASMLALILSVLARWLAHRATVRLAGRAMFMLRGFNWMVALWIALAIAVTAQLEWRWGLAIGLTLPPTLSLGAINPLSPSWSMALPVLAFAALLLLGGTALNLNIRGVEIETAAGFTLMMTIVFAIGWRQFQPAMDQV